MSYDSWGVSWGGAWGNSWLHSDAPPPPVVVTEQGPIPSGGIVPFEERDPYRFQYRRAQPIIEAVAERQVEVLELDETKRLGELLEELKAAQIEYDSRYLVALENRREALMNAEISRLIEANNEDANVRLLLILAAALG